MPGPATRTCRIASAMNCCLALGSQASRRNLPAYSAEVPRSRSRRTCACPPSPITVRISYTRGATLGMGTFHLGKCADDIDRDPFAAAKLGQNELGGVLGEHAVQELEQDLAQARRCGRIVLPFV